MRVRVNRVENVTGGRVVTEATKIRVIQPNKAALRERAFLANLKALGAPAPIPELRFHPTRKWRFDYAWNLGDGVGRVALEVDGAIWTNGRHSRGSGVVKEHEKFNAAAVLGWRILRCTPDQLALPSTAELVRDALGGR